MYVHAHLFEPMVSHFVVKTAFMGPTGFKCTKIDFGLNPLGGAY